MRHMCVLLLLVFGLSTLMAQCYEKECYKSCSWWKCRTKYRQVCCKGYCGANCACTHQCTVTTTYQSECCEYCKRSIRSKRSPWKKRDYCYPCTKRKTETICCGANSAGSKKCPA